MTISTYSELVTAVENFLHRDGLDDRIAEFISLGEARIAREVKARQMEASTTISAGETVALPSDYVSIRAVRVEGSTVGWLDYMTPDEFFNTTASSSSSTTKKYTIFGENLVFPTAPGGDVELWYYKKLAALSGSLNTLFTVNPDLYLYAALAEAGPYLVNQGRALLYEGKFTSIKDSVNLSQKQGRYPAGMNVKVG